MRDRTTPARRHSIFVAFFAIAATVLVGAALAAMHPAAAGPDEPASTPPAAEDVAHLHSLDATS
jgi:hypothetical protein